MRTGSSWSTEVNPGSSQAKAKTSAAKPTTMRTSPGTPRKPKRRSSLSSQVIALRDGRGRAFYFQAVAVARTACRRLGSIAPTCARLPGMSETAQKTTPLYQEHLRLGAKIVQFGGWLMPVQYTGILEEHQAVRNNVGIFDISHMGQLIVSNPAAAGWLNTMLTNNIDKLEVGQGQYTFLLNERGGIIDDLIVYRIGEQRFLLVVNAARTDEDFAWLDRHLPAVKAAVSAANQVRIDNRSADFGGVAIQGPRVAELFHALFGEDVEPPPRNAIVDLPFDGETVSIARTGYTGEDGVEVFFRAQDAAEFWNTVLEKGKDLGIKPCGLGSRDTLRLEMCYPLNGSDLSPKRNPIEAGLGFFVDLTKQTFIGRDVLLETKENG